jgi:hypothetical protein
MKEMVAMVLVLLAGMNFTGGNNTSQFNASQLTEIKPRISMRLISI